MGELKEQSSNTQRLVRLAKHHGWHLRVYQCKLVVLPEPKANLYVKRIRESPIVVRAWLDVY